MREVSKYWPQNLLYGLRVPFLYDLGFLTDDAPQLRIVFSQQIWQFLCGHYDSGKVMKAANAVSAHLQNIDIGNFGFNDAGIGFRDLFKRTKSTDTEEVSFSCCLKDARVDINKETTDWSGALALSATLNVLLDSIYHFTNLGIAESDERQQLFAFDLMTILGDHGSEFKGEVSCDAIEWFRAKARSHLAEISLKMADAWASLWSNYFVHEVDPLWHFRNSIGEEGRFNFDVPGDATGVYIPGYKRLIVDEGAEIECHNVDNPVQQIVLLCALASCTDLMRKDGL